MTGPAPPADLAARRPLTVTLASGTDLHRFHSAAYGPVHFDRTTSGRLNAPDGKYGVLYTAETAEGAFAETFLRRPGRNVIGMSELRAKAYVCLSATRPIRLIRLAGPGLAVIGATAEVTHSGLPYDLPQAWSAALHAHPGGFDGIAYRARHDDDEMCCALFDRSSGAVSVKNHVHGLDADWFWTLAARYSVGLVA